MSKRLFNESDFRFASEISMTKAEYYERLAKEERDARELAELVQIEPMSRKEKIITLISAIIAVTSVILFITIR
jgi:hypothetical protein